MWSLHLAFVSDVRHVVAFKRARASSDLSFSTGLCRSVPTAQQRISIRHTMASKRTMERLFHWMDTVKEPSEEDVDAACLFFKDMPYDVFDKMLVWIRFIRDVGCYTENKAIALVAQNIDFHTNCAPCVHTAMPSGTGNRKHGSKKNLSRKGHSIIKEPVSYTHLTLPTNREV